ELELLGHLIHGRLSRVESGDCARAAHIRRRADVAPRPTEMHPQVWRAVMEGRRFTAILVVVLEDRAVTDIVMLERDELAFRCGAQSHVLLSAGAMARRLERHLPAENELNRLADLPRRRHRQRTMCPRPKFAAETLADKLRDDAHVLVRQTKHLREHAAHVEDGLRFLV